MHGLNPLTRSFALLCIGSALGLALLEWHDPLDWKVADTRSTKAVSPFRTLISITQGHRPNGIQHAHPSDVEIRVQLSQRTIDVYQQGEIVKQYETLH